VQPVSAEPVLTEPVPECSGAPTLPAACSLLNLSQLSLCLLSLCLLSLFSECSGAPTLPAACSKAATICSTDVPFPVPRLYTTQPATTPHTARDATGAQQRTIGGGHTGSSSRRCFLPGAICGETSASRQLRFHRNQLLGPGKCSSFFVGDVPRLGVLNILRRAAVWPVARSITWM